eukprot:5784063-Prymnesium_polylepis.1
MAAAGFGGAATPAMAGGQGAPYPISSGSNDGKWGVLNEVLSAGGHSEAEGAASSHSAAAREEAARKLISNHESVLKDVANPSADKNIIG